MPDCQSNKTGRTFHHQTDNRFARHGFVAFLDLLGYSQIAEKDNEANIASVIDAITRSAKETKVRLAMQDYVDNNQPPLLFSGSIYTDVEYTFISDSIVLHRALSDDAEKYIREFPEDGKLQFALNAYWFIEYVRNVYSALLRKKLPSRCGVTYGKFFWNRNQPTVMAGSALITAHVLSESLEFTGVAIGESITSRISDQLNKLNHVGIVGDITLQGARIPLKDKPKPDMDAIDPVSLKSDGTIVRPNLSRDEIGDIRQFITSQFSSYDKNTVDPHVQRKLENSIAVFRQLYP